ncbi:MAG TPA: CvpA family protein [Candidatus Angelobacter sp.]|nr:CvpA family protein [Candidatus Angelobacter sp.]
MNGLDWLILLIMLCSALLAAAQGFFFEVISLAGVVVGYLLAAWGYRRLAPWFLDYVKSMPVADLAGFLTIFLSVVIFAGVIARIARWMIHEAGLRWMDRALGAAFGFLRGMLIVTAALLAVTAFAPESRELAGSQLAPYFQVAGRGAIWLAPSEIRQKFREGLERLRGKAEPAVKK